MEPGTQRLVVSKSYEVTASTAFMKLNWQFILRGACWNMNGYWNKDHQFQMEYTF